MSFLQDQGPGSKSATLQSHVSEQSLLPEHQQRPRQSQTGGVRSSTAPAFKPLSKLLRSLLAIQARSNMFIEKQWILQCVDKLSLVHWLPCVDCKYQCHDASAIHLLLLLFLPLPKQPKHLKAKQLLPKNKKSQGCPPFTSSRKGHRISHARQ